MRTFMLVVLIAGIASHASATDGVVEINQVAALETGIGGGDGPGFPVLIDRRGSYRLTSDLEVRAVAVPAVDAIQIRADDVTLDLNGFTIHCTTLVGSCSGAGADGIDIAGVKGIHVHSGVIRGFPQHGINGTQTSTAYLIDSIRAIGNGGSGIDSGGIGQITRSQFLENGVYGIHGRAFMDLVLDVLTRDNGVEGIRRTGSAMAVGRSNFYDGATVGSTDIIECIKDGTTRVCPP